MSNYYAGANAVLSTYDATAKLPQGGIFRSNAKQADAALDSITYVPPAHNQMIASVTATYDKCLDTMHRKCHDYAGNDNPYRNFEGATKIGLTVQQGLLIRLQDKFSRLENLLTKQAQVKDESLEDTIEDAINYLAILKARREYEKENGK